MWFKNLQVFRVGGTTKMLEDDLSIRPLQPCGNAQGASIGWVPPMQFDDAYVHEFASQLLIALGVEEKLLPASVVRQEALTRVQTIERNEGRRVGRKGFRELLQTVAQELLPRAFVRRRNTYAWIDPVEGWLVINAAAPARADELVEQLLRANTGLTVKPLRLRQSPASAMTGWLADGNAPAGFSIDQDTELQSAENALVCYARHPLDGEDIPAHIAAGKIVTRLGMTWGDKISFVLTDTLQLKRLAFLDILKESAEGQAENEAERFDLDFALMTGELANLLGDLVEALGGEMAEEA